MEKSTLGTSLAQEVSEQLAAGERLLKLFSYFSWKYGLFAIAEDGTSDTDPSVAYFVSHYCILDFHLFSN